MKENKEKSNKNNKALIILLVLIIITLLAVGSFFAVQYLRLNKDNKEKEIIEEEKEKKEKEDEISKENKQEENVKKEVKILSEHVLADGIHDLKDEEDTLDFDEGYAVYIKEGVFEIELIKGNYADFYLFDVMGDVKLSVALYKDESLNEMKEITETYIYPGMYIKIDDEHIPDNLKGGETIEVSLRRLDKNLDKTSSKLGKTYELAEKDLEEYYIVGENIDPGVYDVELIVGDGGRVYVEYREEKTKLSVSLYKDENLFKDIRLNKGDKLAFLPMSAPGIPEVAPKYKLTAVQVDI